MENQKILKFLKIISQIHGLCIRVFDSKDYSLTYYFGRDFISKTIEENKIRSLLNIAIPNGRYGLLEYNKFLLAGYIRSKRNKYLYLIGPNKISVPTKSDIEDLIERNGLPKIYEKDITNFLHSASSISVEKFCYLMSELNLLINDETINIRDLVDTLSKDTMTNSLEPIYEKYEPYEKTPMHSDGSYEQKLIYDIRNGLVDEIKKISFDQGVNFMGKLGPSQIRSLKNGLIVLNSLCLRAAMSGGLDTEMCYSLGEYYAQKIESTDSLKELGQLSRIIKNDYCIRVRNNKIPEIKNLHIFKATKYIEEKLYSKISASDVAEYIGVQPEYLASLAKKELNTTISKYIIERKITEAKKLLRFSDKSLSDISIMLCFASQSHFQNHFKKIRGITPREYRNLYHSSSYDKIAK